MKIIYLFFFIFGNMGFAATNGFELKIGLSLNGRLASSQRILVIEGMAARVTQENEQVNMAAGKAGQTEDLLLSMIVKRTTL